MCLLGPWVILIPIGSSTWQLIKTQSFSERPYMSLKQKHIVINYYYYNYYLHCMCLCIFREAGPHGSNIPKPESFHSLENGYYIYLFIFTKASRYQSHNHRASEKLGSHILSPNHEVVKSVLQRKFSKYFRNGASENRVKRSLKFVLWLGYLFQDVFTFCEC